MVNDSQLERVDDHQQRNNWGAAVAMCRKLIRRHPQDARLVQRYAVALQQTGDHKRAIRLLEKYVKRSTDDGVATLLLAKSYETRGEQQPALDNYHRATRLRPDDPEAMIGFARVLLVGGAHRQAVQALAQAAELAPGESNIYRMMGAALIGCGEVEQAKESYILTLRLNPTHQQALFELGDVLLAEKSWAEAERLYLSGFKLDPDDNRLLFRLARVYREQRKWKSSARFFHALYKKAPKFMLGRDEYSIVLINMGQFRVALRVLEPALRADPENVNCHIQMASALIMDYDTDGAERHLRSAVEIDPSSSAAANGLGSVYAKKGDSAKAKLWFEKALELEPRLGGPYLALCRSGDLREVDRILMVLERDDVDDLNRLQLHFAAGYLCDKRGEHDLAFAHFEQGNRLKDLDYKPALVGAFFDEIIDVFDGSQSGPNALNDCGVAPVFIVGMPRSGSSLIEQILDTHPKVYGAGELPTIPILAKRLSFQKYGAGIYRPTACLEADTRELTALLKEYIDPIDFNAETHAVFTDKGLGNYQHLGFLSALFPNAKIISCLRNPLDIAVSQYFTAFTNDMLPFTYDLRDIAIQYKNYRRLMQHWRENPILPMLDVPYEKMVEDNEAWSRKIIEFVGLEWDKNCLKFYENKRAVFTASTHQVRKPIYKDSKARWKNYRKFLGPLFDELGIDPDNPPVLDCPETY